MKGPVRVSKHARQRAAEMGVPLPEIVDCVNNCEQEYAQGNYGEGRMMHQSGRLAVATTPGADGIRIAVTVLWRTGTKYERPVPTSSARLPWEAS